MSVYADKWISLSDQLRTCLRIRRRPTTIVDHLLNDSTDDDDKKFPQALIGLVLTIACSI